MLYDPLSTEIHGALYTPDNTSFRWEVWCLPVPNYIGNLTLRLEMRYFVAGETKPKSTTASLTVTQNAQRNVLYIPHCESYLLSMRVSVSSTGGLVPHGACWNVVSLCDYPQVNTPVSATIVSDYVTTSTGVIYPASGVKKSTDGRGCYRMIALPNPLPGGNIQWAAEDNTSWVLHAVTFTLQTSLAAGNRVPFVAHGAFTNSTLNTHPPNTARDYMFSNRYFCPQPLAALGPVYLESLPPEYWYRDPGIGGGAAIDCDNMDVADQLSLGSVTIEQWINV